MAIVTSRRVPVGGRSLTLYEQFPLGRPFRSVRSDSAERLSILVLIGVGNSGCLVCWSVDAAFRISASLSSQYNPLATRTPNVLSWVEKFYSQQVMLLMADIKQSAMVLHQIIATPLIYA